MAEPPAQQDADEPDLEAGRLLFAKECTFLLGATKPTQLPDRGLGEIAFAGRSNVGKSSLVNALTGRKTLARTSNTPGRTQQLNFFDLGGTLVLVDLPGYGYARASRSAVKQWTGLTRDYLKGRRELLRVYLLIDARHGLKPNDLEIMEELDEAAVSYQIVLTKADKMKGNDLAATIDKTTRAAARHPAAFPALAHKIAAMFPAPSV